jgi:hypothetical protein
MVTSWHHYSNNVWEVPFDQSGTEEHFSAGLFYRLGSPIKIERLSKEAPHRFLDKTNLALFSANLLAHTADAITTQRALANCRRNSPHPNDPLYGCAQLETNSFARPFVSDGWGGQIAFTAIVNAGEILTSFALHRMGHHRVERLLVVTTAATEAYVAHHNLQKPY